MHDLKYFSPEEFDSPDLPGSHVNMDPQFLKLLDLCRERAAIPFKITSGYRTAERNKQVGGVENSSHLKGVAVDVAAPDSRTKYKIIQAALSVGINRIGCGSNFVHLDRDLDKVPSVIWTY